MKKITILFAASVLSLSLGTHARAHDYKMGEISIAHPWTRATLPNAPVGGGYMTITNGGSEAVTLAGATTPAAETVEVHTMEMEDGVMRMEKLDGGLTIEAGETIELKPGGLHLMMMGLADPIAEGASIPVTLQFSGDKTIDVDLAAEAIGGSPDGVSQDGSMAGMDHGSMNMGASEASDGSHEMEGMDHGQNN